MAGWLFKLAGLAERADAALAGLPVMFGVLFVCFVLFGVVFDLHERCLNMFGSMFAERVVEK